MLEEYFKLHARPVDWIAPPGKTDDRKKGPQESSRPTRFPEQSSMQDEEDGYDPYDHPLDRSVIEKHLERFQS